MQDFTPLLQQQNDETHHETKNDPLLAISLDTPGKKRDVFKKIKGEFSHVVNLSGYVDHVNKKKTYNTHYKGVKNLYSFAF